MARCVAYARSCACLQVVKNFLYAMEACQGRFVFPDAPSLEYIGTGGPHMLL